MDARRRWLVFSIALMLLIGVARYRQHVLSPSAKPSVPARPSTSAPRTTDLKKSSSLESDRGTDSNQLAERETVVCGTGTVQLDSKDAAAPFNFVDRLTRNAQAQWRLALLESDDYRERAAGLLLRGSGWDYDSATGMPVTTSQAQLARDELVQLAVGLNDLSVYAMAIRACDANNDDSASGSACAQVSLARWAHMDADNAAPWLEMAAAANARSDQAAVLDAINHALRAHSVDFYNDSPLSYASSGMPPATTPLQQAAFFQKQIGHVGSDGFAHAFVTARYCTAARVQESAIHEQCAALAELLAGRGRNTLDLSAAATVGARVGWDSDRVAAMREEILAMFRIEGNAGKDPWSCEHVRALTDFAALQARSGEVAAARAAIVKSGKTISELAEEQKDALQESNRSMSLR